MDTGSMQASRSENVCPAFPQVKRETKEGQHFQNQSRGHEATPEYPGQGQIEAGPSPNRVTVDRNQVNRARVKAK